MAMFFRSPDAMTDSAFFRKIIPRSLEWVLITEFIVNLYPFGLITELILVPVVTLLVFLSAISYARPEFAPLSVANYPLRSHRRLPLRSIRLASRE